MVGRDTHHPCFIQTEVGRGRFCPLLGHVRSRRHFHHGLSEGFRAFSPPGHEARQPFFSDDNWAGFAHLAPFGATPYTARCFTRRRSEVQILYCPFPSQIDTITGQEPLPHRSFRFREAEVGWGRATRSCCRAHITVNTVQVRYRKLPTAKVHRNNLR
jgi:hypothetical protein